jgi:hypothetical protein
MWTDAVSEEEHLRKNDVAIEILTQRFNDFIERYDRDCGASQEWRRTTEKILKEQSDILLEISPAYNRGKWVVGLIMIGSVGLAVKAFWQHVKWTN